MARIIFQLLKPKNLIMVCRSIYIILWLTLITMYQVYRGIYRREIGAKNLLIWADRLLELVDLKYEVYNPNSFKFDKGKPYIIMSNHRSHYDIPLIFSSLREGYIRMLTKKELFKIPIWGKGMEIGEFISIDRHNREQARKDLEKAKEKMESGIILWVAPEGTRSSTSELLPFKKGGFKLAMETGATIIPVGIRDSHKVLPARTADFSFGETASVYVGKPVDATKYDRVNRDELVAEVRRQLKDLGGYSDQEAGLK